MTEQIDYDPNTILEALNNKADRDLNNVTDGTYQVLTTKNITNCIIKIPQDIKLELSTDGTLTLKAGSKVYKCDGTAVNITSDAYPQVWETNEQVLVFYSIGSGNLPLMSINRCFSGDVAPDSAADNTYWFDTINKVIKQYSSSSDSWSTTSLTLPIAIVTMTGNENNVTSIDQVFNGFGYIGSTIFALPGIEGLIPNGHNLDGSLNNGKYTINNVLTVQAGITSNGYFGIVNGSLLRRYPGNSVYDEAKNVWYNPETGNNFQFLYCGNFSEVSSRITSLTPKTIFQAIDRNDTEWASTASKPSDRYLDLTLGASDSVYTAPANGWVWLRKHVTEIGQYVELAGRVADICYSGRNNTVAEVYIPVKKNDMFRASYTAAGETIAFRFIYDEGVK